MNIRRSWPLPVLLLVVLSLAACSDDDPAAPGAEPDVLLTIDFDDYPGTGDAGTGIVFASDAAGNVLDTATWSGRSTVVLRNSDIHPDTISFTLVPFPARARSLFTELGVPVGSARSFAGEEQPALSGSAQLAFRNVPECEQFRLVYNGTSVQGGIRFPSDWTVDIYGSMTRLFVRYDPVGGVPMGGWWWDIRPGDVDTLDLRPSATIRPLAASVVRIPGGGDFASCSVSEILDTDPARRPVRLESRVLVGSVPETITLHVSAFDSTNVITEYYQESGVEPWTYHWQESRGEVPTTISHLEGELTLTSTSRDSLAFTTTAAWDGFLSAWGEPGGFGAVWHVAGPAPLRTFALPPLPHEVIDLYPDLAREDFVLAYLEIFQDTSEGLVRSLGVGLQFQKHSGADRRRPDVLSR